MMKRLTIAAAFLKAVMRKIWREVYFTRWVQMMLLKRKVAYSFDRAKTEWSHVPVDNIGYLDTGDLCAKSDDDLLRLAKTFERIRYDLKGWRNHQNLWREFSGVDTIRGKHILDFGCGFGIEALQFAKNGNRVSLADISPDNLRLAGKVLQVSGYDPSGILLVSSDYPFFDAPKCPVDVFYSNGVLHHTPKIREILKRAVEVMSPSGGEIRLMLYSDVAWQISTRAPLPASDKNTADNPHFFQFVRFYDSYGEYADWYSREKLECLLGDFLNIREFHYITKDRRYLMTTLVPKAS